MADLDHHHCIVCGKRVREGMLYCSGLSPCWYAGRPAVLRTQWDWCAERGCAWWDAWCAAWQKIGMYYFMGHADEETIKRLSVCGGHVEASR